MYWDLFNFNYKASTENCFFNMQKKKLCNIDYFPQKKIWKFYASSIGKLIE